MFLQGGGDRFMKAVVKKWGNSASVRIPAAVLQAAKLRLDDSVDVREECGRIVIEPVARKEYTLSELLKGITPENVHEEADFGGPRGKERACAFFRTPKGVLPRIEIRGFHRQERHTG